MSEDSVVEKVLGDDAAQQPPVPRRSPAQAPPDRYTGHLHRLYVSPTSFTFSLDESWQVEVTIAGAVSRSDAAELEAVCSTAARQMFMNGVIQFPEYPVIENTDKGWRIRIGVLSTPCDSAPPPVIRPLAGRKNLPESFWLDFELGLLGLLLAVVHKKDVDLTPLLCHTLDVELDADRGAKEEGLDALSTADATRVIEKYLASLPAELQRAIAVFLPRPARSTEELFEEVIAFAKEDEGVLRGSQDLLNNLLAECYGREFESESQLREIVQSIRIIVTRGGFRLLLDQSGERLKKGTPVGITVSAPRTPTHSARMVVKKDGKAVSKTRFIGIRLDRHV